MLGKYESDTLRSSSGTAIVVEEATITVKRESDGALAAIYSDEPGASPLANPFTLAAGVYTIAFYASPAERYRIDIVQGVYSRTLRHEQVSMPAMEGITNLSIATALDGTEEIPVVQTTTKKSTVQDIIDFLLGRANTFTATNDFTGDVKLNTVTGTAGFGVRHNGTGPRWAAPAVIVGDHKNLVIANDGTNPNYQIDITADAIILENSSGGAKKVTSVSTTVDITASGINGKGSAAAEASDTWYYIWYWAKEDGTKGATLDVSSSSPTAPTDYTYKALLGAARNDGSSNFLPFEQQDKRVVYTTNQGILDGALTGAAWTAVSITSFFPATAKRVMIAFAANTNAMGIAPYSTGAAGEYFYATNTSGGNTVGGAFTTGRNAAFSCSCLYKSSIYYYVGAAVNGTLMATGWEY